MSATRPPQRKAPDLTCDCQFHIFGPHDRFPLDAVQRLGLPTPAWNPAPEVGGPFDQFVEWILDSATRQCFLVDNAAKLSACDQL